MKTKTESKKQKQEDRHEKDDTNRINGTHTAYADNGNDLPNGRGRQAGDAAHGPGRKRRRQLLDQPIRSHLWRLL